MFQWITKIRRERRARKRMFRALGASQHELEQTWDNLLTVYVQAAIMAQANSEKEKEEK